MKKKTLIFAIPFIFAAATLAGCGPSDQTIKKVVSTNFMKTNGSDFSGGGISKGYGPESKLELSPPKNQLRQGGSDDCYVAKIDRINILKKEPPHDKDLKGYTIKVEVFGTCTIRDRGNEIVNFKKLKNYYFTKDGSGNWRSAD